MGAQMENEMSDFKITEAKTVYPNYDERLKEGSVIDLRSNDTEDHKDYENEFMNSTFWGLNCGGGPEFHAIKIDEAAAFTLHINSVAVIPKDIFNCVVAIDEGKSTVDDLMAIYNKHCEAIKAAKAI